MTMRIEIIGHEAGNRDYQYIEMARGIDRHHIAITDDMELMAVWLTTLGKTINEPDAMIHVWADNDKEAIRLPTDHYILRFSTASIKQLIERLRPNGFQADGNADRIESDGS